MRDKDHVKIHKCPSGAYILTKYPFICNPLLSVIPHTITTILGQIVPKLFPSNQARTIYPPSPHIVQNSRELSVKDTQHLRLTSACPFLTTPTALFSGGISSRAVPSPILGKDGEMGLNIREVYDEHIMKEAPIMRRPPRRTHRKARLNRSSKNGQ